jgi:hypothetical protein
VAAGQQLGSRGRVHGTRARVEVEFAGNCKGRGTFGRVQCHTVCVCCHRMSVCLPLAFCCGSSCPAYLMLQGGSAGLQCLPSRVLQVRGV